MLCISKGICTCMQEHYVKTFLDSLVFTKHLEFVQIIYRWSQSHAILLIPLLIHKRMIWLANSIRWLLKSFHVSVYLQSWLNAMRESTNYRPIPISPGLWFPIFLLFFIDQVAERLHPDTAGNTACTAGSTAHTEHKQQDQFEPFGPSGLSAQGPSAA